MTGYDIIKILSEHRRLIKKLANGPYKCTCSPDVSVPCIGCDKQRLYRDLESILIEEYGHAGF